MNTRSKIRRELSPVLTTERLLTKKEMESKQRRHKTCPQVPKKNHIISDYLKKKIHSKGDGNATPIYYARPTSLSSNYDPNKGVTYLSQLFWVYECIGEGSFGVVYKARYKEDGKLYAIKLMKRHAFERGDYDEVKRVEKIGEHEHLVKFHMAWQEKGIVYMQLELCALSLALYTKTNHELPNSQLWDIFIDMLHALKHLHDNALVHLDIKPDNIMISEDGKYKLGDFGLLMDLNERVSPGTPSSHTSEGDAKYLAKEVLEGTYTTAADIFSLGISMLELASDLVLPGNGPLWHLLRDGTYSSDYFKLVPSRLRNVIVKMMIPNAKSRPSVAGILKFTSVKKAIDERENKSRVNYYEIWKAQNVDENDVAPVTVYLNPRSTPPNVSDKENDSIEPLNASACVTPPRCVSQVILYNI